jgi:hypothetical protein
VSKKIVNKSVSFNVVDPFQQQMKEHVEQYPNFSAYMKRLIQRDMEEGTKVRTIKKAPSQVVSNLNMTQLNGFKL